MPDLSNKAKAVFDQALELASPADRAALLDRECAGDPGLRGRVEELLRAYADAGSFLERPPAGPAATVGYEPAAAGPGPGTLVAGRYKLLEGVGEGGMGTVWMAQQTEPVKRLVAVKLVKAGMDSKQVLARFEAERQALALMDHPNIAKVHDAGVAADGRPFFVMELVKGVPITRFCDEHRLTPRQRLELFIPVCHAVQHAHQKGVIHRDLKPSNVLVALYDDKPVPKVIDFGVAKATGQQLTDQTLHTGFGTVVGTLEYMSPEQATFNQLDIDTRSDVYSLGVLLYELLTGGPPFGKGELGKAGMLEMLRVIREQEPSRPSTKLSTAEGLPTLAANRGTEPAKLTRLVRGELDWIVMKALEKDRNRRYETANGFALDVQRYLADEPVLACPPSAGYRLKKFARRNKGGLAAAVLVLFFLALLGGGVGWAARDRAARHAKVAGQVELILAEVDRLEKEQKWPEALAAARRAEAAAAGGDADAATAQRVRERLKDLEFLDRLEQVRMQRATLVDGKFDDAGADRDYARAFRDYGVDVEALAVEASVDRLKARPELSIPLAAALDDWVQARRAVSGKDTAGWERLVAVARGIDPEPVRDRLRSTWGQPVSEVKDELRRLAESIDVRAHHPATVTILARTLWRIRQSDPALRVLRDAQYLYPGDFWLNAELSGALFDHKDYEGASRFANAAVAVRPNSAGAHNTLGIALRNQKKLDEAIAALRKAIELDPKYAGAYSNLGVALIQQGRLDEAIAACRKAIELDPKNSAAHNNLGSALRGQKKLDEAVAAHRKAIELNPKDSGAHSNLGNALKDQNKPDEAVAAYRKAIELDPKFAVAYYNLGGALRGQKKLDEAVEAYCTAIELDPKYAEAYYYLGVALREQNKLDEAIAAHREAVRLKPDLAAAHYDLFLALQKQRKLEQAILPLEKVIELEPNHARRHDELAWLVATSPDLKSRDAKRAVELARRAVELSPEHSGYWRTLGVTYYRASRWGDALAALEKAMAPPRGGDSFDWFFLAMAHWQMGNKEEARKWYDRAAQWMAKNRPADGELRRFRAEAQELLGIQDHRPFQGHSEPVRRVAFFPDGRRALSAGHDRTIRLWDVTGGKELACWKGHTDMVTSVIPSPDGRRALSGSLDRSMRLWDVATGKELLRVEHPGLVDTVAFSPDGRQGLSGGQDGTIRLWDLESGQELAKFAGHTGTVRSVAFAPDGKTALSGSHDKTVRLWDVATGKEIRRFDGHTQLILSVAFSPDGRQVLSGGCDRTLRLWDVETGKPRGAFPGHQGNIEGVAFSPDGRRGLTGSLDGTVRLWDLTDERELHSFGTDDVLAVAFSPDGRQVLSSHKDAMVRLWALPDVDRD